MFLINIRLDQVSLEAFKLASNTFVWCMDSTGLLAKSNTHCMNVIITKINETDCQLLKRSQ